MAPASCSLAPRGTLRAARCIAVEALAPLDTFERRHNSVSGGDLEAMLSALSFPSLDALVDATVPASIRRAPMNLGKYDAGLPESVHLAQLKCACRAGWRPRVAPRCAPSPLSPSGCQGSCVP